jgi:hypothetical protein
MGGRLLFFGGGSTCLGGGGALSASVVCPERSKFDAMPFNPALARDTEPVSLREGGEVSAARRRLGDGRWPSSARR